MTEINAVPAKGMEEKPVKVNLRKLTAGIGTMFAGVLEMLDALDASSASNLVSSFCEGKSAPVSDAAANVATDAIDHIGEKAAGSITDSAEKKDDTAVSPAETKEEPAAQSASSLSQDDITRVIVRKIKQDRANSEKIATILKGYGVERVSDLPAEKYEAFLTYISAI